MTPRSYANGSILFVAVLFRDAAFKLLDCKRDEPLWFKKNDAGSGAIHKLHANPTWQWLQVLKTGTHRALLTLYCNTGIKSARIRLAMIYVLRTSSARYFLYGGCRYIGRSGRYGWERRALKCYMPQNQRFKKINPPKRRVTTNSPLPHFHGKVFWDFVKIRVPYLYSAKNRLDYTKKPWTVSAYNSGF